MTIRAVIFDLGGVLIRTVESVTREQMAARLGVTRLDLEEMVFGDDSGTRAQRGEIQANQHWENLRLRLKMTPEEITIFQKDFWSGDRLDTKLVDYIRGLRQSYRTALLSNAFSDLREMITRRWKIADAFDEIVISSEVGMMKPDPLIYRFVLERLNVAAPEAVFVDDFVRNVEGARVVGMHAVHFRTSEQVRAELEMILNEN